MTFKGKNLIRFGWVMWRICVRQTLREFDCSVKARGGARR